MIAPYDCLCQECVGSCSFCSDDSRNLTASLWNFYYLLHISMHLSYCLLQTSQGFLRWHWCMLFSQCCSWFRSLLSPSPFWAQRCFTVLFDDFTWFAMVSSQVPFLSQDWESWKTMPHINAHAPVPGCEGQSRSGGSHSQMVYLVPSSIVQKQRNDSDWSEDDPSWNLKVPHFRIAALFLYLSISFFMYHGPRWLVPGRGWCRQVRLVARGQDSHATGRSWQSYTNIIIINFFSKYKLYIYILMIYTCYNIIILFHTNIIIINFSANTNYIYIYSNCIYIL